ncbi:MAG TPA: ABC transporter permease, partial [Chitinophagaceae bacterium]|nr:ABC transporter permease [Chitinophagaceae bacterium]
IKNYFLIAWRNLWKHKVFSAINILGLSAGLACCILMFLFIQHELSFDKFNQGSENIYRVISDMETTSGKDTLAVTPAPWAALMKKDFPEIKEYVRLLKDEKVLIGQPNEQHYYETKMLYADSTLFDVFSIELEKGDVKHPLDRPNSIILTNETAKKYFGNADPIGKTLEVNSFGRSFTVEVTAIAKQLPANSHFNFNSLISMQTLGDLSSLWSFHMFNTYVALNEKSDPKILEKKFEGFVSKYIINNPQADGKNDIHLQRLTDIHLRSNYTGEIGTNGDITYLYIFAGVAIFVLLIACFNFTNLSTARSLTRAKEVGLRKVIGADKKQLFSQFLSETTLFAFIALILAIIICYLVLPLFNQLSGRELTIDFQKNYSLIVVLIALVAAIGLLAGLYPAAVLSAFKPIEVLKGKFSRSGKGVSFRKVLVTLQFIISIGLIASTLLVREQLHFLQNTKLGFDKENVMVLTLPRDTDSTRLQSFKTSLLSNREIRSVAASSTIPNNQVPVNLVNDGSTDLKKAISMQMLFTDDDFLRTMKMEVVAGRDWNAKMPTDKSAGFVINEEAAKKFGWKDPQQAVGKTIQWVQPETVLKTGVVIGVVKNFNITPLKTAVQPLVMHQFPQRYQYLYVRFDQNRAATVLPLVQKQFNALYAKQSFEYSFLDETLNNLYSSERKLGSIFTYFSLLAIIIACMGVLGLSLYSIQQRIKEIGIRKVLGASVFSITGELLKEFVKPVLIAAVIATPLAWYFMNIWLSDFAYRIEI